MACLARAIRSRSLRSSPRAGKPLTWRREAGESNLINLGESERLMSLEALTSLKIIGIGQKELT